MLDTAEGLDFVDNDKKLYTELLNSFINDKPFEKERLISLVNSGKNIDASRYVHLFKGAAAQIGAKRLASDAGILCDVLRGRQKGNPELLIQNFIRSYAKTLQILQETFQKLK